MNWKKPASIGLSIITALGAAAVVASMYSAPSQIRIGLTRGNGGLEYSINDRPVTVTRFVEVMSKLATLDTNQRLFLSVTERVSATDLLLFIHQIRESGLHHVVISGPSDRDGEIVPLTAEVDIQSQKVFNRVLE
jgi:hypothetical protein